MKTISKFSQFATVLLLLSTSLIAQFDDVYYDPDRQSEKSTRSLPKENYSDDQNTSTDSKSYNNQEYGYDDEYSEDYDYYYTSRIKRFHQGRTNFDYYDPYFVDVYHYDPFSAFLWGTDIYAINNSYSDYWRWRRWNRHNRWNAYTYWNHWDWCYGMSPYTMSYRYYYQPYDPWCYYGGYNSYGFNNYYYGNNYNNHHGGYNGGYYGDNNREYGSNNPKGTYYGSRQHGVTQTSKMGLSSIEVQDSHLQ